MTALEIGFLFATASVAGALNSLAGGGSFLTFPALVFAGVPPVVANATNSVAVWPGSVAGTFAYRDRMREMPTLLAVLGSASFFGGLLGAVLLLLTSDAAFMGLVPWLLLTATLVFTAGNAIAKRLRMLRVSDGPVSRKMLVLLFVVQFVIGTYGGYFGGGMGIMTLAALSVLGFTDIQAMNGLKIVLTSIINGIAIFIFIAMGKVAWLPALLMAVGATAGGYFGAMWGRRIDAKWLRRGILFVAWGMTAYFFAKHYAPHLTRPRPCAGFGGYFEGKGKNDAWGEFDITVNLRCKGEVFEGDVFAGPAAPIVRAVPQGRRIEIGFGAGQDKLELEADGDKLRGRIAADGESADVALERKGDGRPPPHLDLTPEQWREDLRFLGAELPKRHAAAFDFMKRDAYEAAIAELDRKLPESNGDAAFVGLNRIANSIGDGHTYIRPPPGSPLFPIEVRRFGEEYRLVAVGKAEEGDVRRGLGARIAFIDGKPMSEVRERLWSLTPADENPSLREERLYELLKSGLALHGAGVLSARHAATFTFVDDVGMITETTFAARTSKPAEWTWAFENVPLYRQKPDETFWFASLPEPHTKVIYCSFRKYADLERHGADLMKAVDAQKPDKLVIDLRLNRGGDFNEGVKRIITPIAQRPHINQKGRLFVLVGAETFSAAMSNASQFRAMTAATLVGEPIGEKPNSYQEPSEVKLPNSGLVLRYSTRFYDFLPALADGGVSRVVNVPPEGQNVIRPDQSIETSWADFKAGRDPVLAWILEQPVSR